MRFKNVPAKLTVELYNWLKEYAFNLGESMNTIIRRALTEYRKNHEKI